MSIFGRKESSKEEDAKMQYEMHLKSDGAADAKPVPISAFEWNGKLYRTERDVQIAKAVCKAKSIWHDRLTIYSDSPSIITILSQKDELDKLVALLKEFDLT